MAKFKAVGRKTIFA